MKKFAYIVLFFFAFIVTTCSAISSGDDDNQLNISSISLSSTSITVDAGDITYIKLTINPSTEQKNIIPIWDYDKSLISVDGSSYGATITGLHEGNTYVKCTVNGIVATCLVKVVGNIIEGTESQYIYSNYSVVELMPGDSTSVSVSLYGGNSEQLENFRWSVKDDDVITYEAARNNCLITAKKNGTTILTASHPDCKYDYSIVIFSHSDAETPAYITTAQNVVSINASETSSKVISFSVENPVTNLSNNKFSYSNVSDNENKDVFEFFAAGNEVSITPKKSGLGRLRVHNEECEYDLDVLIKVKTSVDNVYLNLSTTTLLVNGSESSYSVVASIDGYTGGMIDNNAFVWEVDTSYKTTKPVEKMADWYSNGNTLSVTGKVNGVFKMKCSHPLAKYSRSVMVILTNQIGSAIDASMYITTTSNYLATKVGANESIVNVSLVGGEQGDENNFFWAVDQLVEEEDRKSGKNSVIKIETSTGYVKNHSRAAVDSGSYAYGSIHITPLAKGTATIYVGHEKCLYETEILVKVYSEDALLSTPIKIEWNDNRSYIGLVNGKSENVTVSLSNASSGDENHINWKSADSSKVSVSPSTGTTSVLTACGSGSGQTYITLTHSKAIAEKRILVLTADTEEELKSMKAIFSQNTYIRMNENAEKTLSLEYIGLDATDLMNINWTSSNSNVVAIKGYNSGSDKHSVIISGVSSGHSTVTASLSGCTDVIFDIVVLPEDESVDLITDPYLTTLQNAVVITDKNNGSATLEVIGKYMSDTDLTNTIWTEKTLSDGRLLDVIGNGNKATIRSQGKEGKTTVIAHNSKAMNELTFNVKIGAYYEYTDNIYPYIVSEKDTFTGIVGDSLQIGFQVEDSNSVGTWSYSISEGSENADVLTYTSGKESVCTVSLKKAGQAILKVHNSLTDSITGSKEILLIIANSPEELAEIRYLTTNQNVVAIGQGKSTTVTVSIANANKNITSGYKWTSSNDNIAIVSSGATAVITGRKIGTSKISVTNTEYCEYPLEIIVTVVDPIAAADNPYITSNVSVVTLTVGDDYKDLIVDLVGGKESDYSAFEWNSDKSSICTIYGRNETGKIKAISEGTALITVTHPKSANARNILVICQAASKQNYYISLSESIITMSPDDSSRTITAELINGNGNDIYDFDWWADEYETVNLNPAQNACVITPKKTGTVNIYVKHPKAANYKTIVVTVTQFTTFKFEAPYASVQAGKTSFINVQIPTTSYKTTVSYKPIDSSIVQIAGATNSVVSIRGLKEGFTTINAQLLTEDGKTILSTDSLLVTVTKADVDPTYIDVGNSMQYFTRSDTNKYSISVKLQGSTGTVNPYSWNWQYDEGVIVPTTNDFASGVNNLNTLYFYAKKAGKVSVTVSYGDYSTMFFIIVTGEEDPSVSLNYSSLTLLENEDAVKFNATVKNATANDIVWSVWDESKTENVTVKNIQTGICDESVVILSGSGSSVSIIPKNVGSVWLCATVKEKYSTYCQITVKKSAALSFDKDKLNIYPYDSYVLEYEVNPPSDKVTWTFNDSSYATIVTSKNSDGSSTVKENGKYVSTPNSEGKGIITICGTINEGSSVLTGTSTSLSKKTLIVNNNYGNNFSVSHNIISLSPDDAVTITKKGNQSVDNSLKLRYEIAPYNAVIFVDTDYKNEGYMGKLKIKESNGWIKLTDSNKNSYIQSYLPPTSSSVYSSFDYIYVNPRSISELSADEYDVSTGIKTGEVEFEVEGECNGQVLMYAVNPNYKTSSSTSQTKWIASQVIDVKIYYESITLRPYNTAGNIGVDLGTGSNPANTYWSSTAKAFVIGDGESMSMTFKTDKTINPYADVDVYLDKTEDLKTPTLLSKTSDGVTITSNTNILPTNGRNYSLADGKAMEVGWIPKSTSTMGRCLTTWYGNQATGKKYYEFNNMRLSVSDNKVTLAHCQDYRGDFQPNGVEVDTTDTVVYMEQIGVLRIRYKNVKNKSTIQYSDYFDFPVFVRVRNSSSTGYRTYN